MVQGKGSKDFSEAKRFCFEQPEAAKLLLQKITETTISYMKAQIKAGAQAFQLFDSWAGLLSPEDFMVYSYPYLKQIIAHCSAPNILFAKGSWYALEELKATGADAIGVDWAVSPEKARKILGHDVTIQGNFDPSRLYASIPEIEKWTKEMINRFGKKRYIVNLGHGILPNVPLDNAKAFINAVKNYSEIMGIKAAFSQHLLDLQNRICKTLEDLDGKTKFIEDPWKRLGGVAVKHELYLMEDSLKKEG